MGVIGIEAGGGTLVDRAAADDAALVEAVRRGDDRAFEELYGRYRSRITGFVAGKVHDHARAEDITQDVFVSALRRIRATEAAIAFRPWIYEIARNACIDAFRRGRRAEQVPLESDRLAPADRERLVAGDPAPEAAVAVKEELDHLRGAFGSLSDAHHEILVLRELEGMSYEAIGEQLGMTKAGVESTLFRARRRLGEEFEDLASGERCAGVQAIVADAAHRRLGVRERRRVTSHATHCDPCRRVAVRAGFEIGVPRRRRVARRLGGWLPIPAFLRRGGDEIVTAAAGRGGWLGQLPGLLEPGWGKAVAGVAALAIAGAGAGVTASRGQEPPASAPAQATATSTAPTRAADADGAAPHGTARAQRAAVRGSAGEPVTRRRGAAPAAGRRDAPAGDRRADRAPAGGGAKADSGSGSGSGSADGGGSDGATQPVRDAVRDTVAGTRQTVRDTVDTTRDTVRDTVQGTGQAVQQTGQNATDTVEHAGSNTGNTVDNATQNVQQTLQQPTNVAPNVTQTTQQAVDDVSKTAGDAADDVDKTVGGLLNP